MSNTNLLEKLSTHSDHDTIQIFFSIQFILVKSSVPNGHNYSLFTILKTKNKNNEIYIKTKLTYQYPYPGTPHVSITRYTKLLQSLFLCLANKNSRNSIALNKNRDT